MTEQLIFTDEHKRRKRERYIIVAVAAAILILTYIESHISNIGSNLPTATNVIVFGLINVNIILLILLVFLILRNFVKLIFERRSKIVGSRLRTRLIFAFVGLSIVPTFLLFFVVIGFINKSIEGWFGIRVEDSLRESLELGQNYYKDTSDKMLAYANQVGAKIAEEGLAQDKDKLRIYIEKKMAETGVSSIEVFSVGRQRIGYVIANHVTQNMVPDISTEQILDTFKGNASSFIQTLEHGDMARGASPVFSADRKTILGAVVVSYYVSRSFIAKMKEISTAFESYKQLKILKTPLKASYFTTLLIITMVIVFFSIWIGRYIAKEITVPIQQLAYGTNEIANGNLDYRIGIEARDEIGVLVNSFNKMTGDLKATKTGIEEANRDLKKTNTELEQRRRYMEIVLSNVAAGVISIDKSGNVTTINRIAEELLGLVPGMVLGKNYRDILRPKNEDFLNAMIAEMKDRGIENLERYIQIDLKGKSIPVLMNLTILKDDDGNYLGMVAVFEDLSNLLKSQRMAAWKEVAQRIAHEVKNPLTPIQLSAQRLSKRYKERFSGEEALVFDECTRTIIKQVDELKTLVNEFSNFARMPSANPAPNNMNDIIKEAAALYHGMSKSISFNLHMDENLPILDVDRDQMKRVIINLLDNSIASIDGSGTITLETYYDKGYKIARVEIADTGCGIPEEDKPRLFEPYFSTKKSGDGGLGLAIVNDIITDHRGYIRVKDNTPRGTRFIIELPVKGV
ncbi:MAG: PAS domain S-box protein [Deltaproteobacteria bacterium]|nr:PAS domain S-box protein [Deltaproteobacteria bacterium]